MREHDRVLVEILIAAPIDVVWHALRDPAEIRRWFGWEHPGLIDEVDAMFAGEATASDADHTLRIAGMSDRYVLEASGDAHTIVRVIRSAPATDPGWAGIYDDALEGWLAFTQQLRFMLEHHPGDPRRTLFLNGRAKGAGTPLPAEALGLTSLTPVPVGQRYALTTATGDTFEGALWFRSTYQLGLTVDGYGNGLIVVATRPTTAKSPHGGGTVTITTYGLDDRTFTGLCDRWTDWWRNRYEVIEISAVPTPSVSARP
jgi:hypothetical protein